MTPENPYEPPQTSESVPTAAGNPRRGRIILIVTLLLYMLPKADLIIRSALYGRTEVLLPLMLPTFTVAILWILTLQGRNWARITLGVLIAISIPLIIYVIKQGLSMLPKGSPIIPSFLINRSLRLVFDAVLVWVFLFSPDVKALHQKLSELVFPREPA